MLPMSMSERIRIIILQLPVGSPAFSIENDTHLMVLDLNSNDLRCNVGGGSGAGTETVSVAAGASIAMSLDVAVYHQGPIVSVLRETFPFMTIL